MKVRDTAKLDSSLNSRHLLEKIDTYWESGKRTLNRAGRWVRMEWRAHWGLHHWRNLPDVSVEAKRPQLLSNLPCILLTVAFGRIPFVFLLTAYKFTCIPFETPIPMALGKKSPKPSQGAGMWGGCFGSFSHTLKEMNSIHWSMKESPQGQEMSSWMLCDKAWESWTPAQLTYFTKSDQSKIIIIAH